MQKRERENAKSEKISSMITELITEEGCSEMTMLKYISRIITGVVFISRVYRVKSGRSSWTTYKFQDYFTAFNLEFLKNIVFLTLWPYAL